MERLFFKKQSVRKESIMYDSNYMVFWKKQNYGDRIKISDCQRLGVRGEVNSGEHQIF